MPACGTSKRQDSRAGGDARSAGRDLTGCGRSEGPELVRATARHACAALRRRRLLTSDAGPRCELGKPGGSIGPPAERGRLLGAMPTGASEHRMLADRTPPRCGVCSSDLEFAAVPQGDEVLAPRPSKLHRHLVGLRRGAEKPDVDREVGLEGPVARSVLGAGRPRMERRERAEAAALPCRSQPEHAAVARDVVAHLRVDQQPHDPNRTGSRPPVARTGTGPTVGGLAVTGRLVKGVSLI